MEIDISGWHGVDRQEKKDAKRRAKHRKAQSVEEQQQVETSIGEEAGGEDDFTQRLLQQMDLEEDREEAGGEDAFIQSVLQQMRDEDLEEDRD